MAQSLKVALLVFFLLSLPLVNPSYLYAQDSYEFTSSFGDKANFDTENTIEDYPDSDFEDDSETGSFSTSESLPVSIPEPAFSSAENSNTKPTDWKEIFGGVATGLQTAGAATNSQFLQSAGSVLGVFNDASLSNEEAVKKQAAGQELSYMERPWFSSDLGLSELNQGANYGTTVTGMLTNDILHPWANSEKIQELNKGMEGLNAEERQAYIREHAQEYKDAGAISIFDRGSGERVVNGNVNYSDTVQYLPLGDAEQAHQTQLRGAMVELTKYRENANVAEQDLPNLTSQMHFFKNKDGQQTPQGFATGNEIAPGVFASSSHVIPVASGDRVRLGYVSESQDQTNAPEYSINPDKKVYMNSRGTFTVDRVVQGNGDFYSNQDVRIMTLDGDDNTLKRFDGQAIPVMYLNPNAPQEGETVKAYWGAMAKSEIKGPSGEELQGRTFYPAHFSEAVVQPAKYGATVGTDFEVMHGLSGTHAYTVNASGAVELIAPLTAADAAE